MINYQLLIHNILFLGGGIVNVVIVLAVLYVRRKNINNLVVTFVMMTLSVAVFQISHVLGANAATAVASRDIFMFNLANIPINMFMAHWFLALIGKTKERRPVLWVIYSTGIALFIFYLIYPSTFLLESVPKMYFPFYYVPGPLQWIMRVWFNLVGVYYFLELVFAWRREVDPIAKNRYLYVLIAILYGFVVGSSAILLVYNVQFDPMWASFFSLYIVFISYAVVRYQLLEVKIIIQRAAIYALSVVALISFISFANSFSVILAELIPGFPSWIVPLVFSLFGVAVGILIWNKLKENDQLKYEFITVIAHKFRTPLTQVKWIAEELLHDEQNQERRDNLQNIEVSNEKLVGLTGALIALAEADSSQSLYSFKKNSLCDLVNSVSDSFKSMFGQKDINFVYNCPSEDIMASIDPERIKFVIQTLLENAYNYTKNGGMVTLEIRSTGSRAEIVVKDTGIGIRQADVPLLFAKFYRGKTGKIADTEGFGIGLYLAQSIIRRHGGKITVASEGEGKGSTFTVSLPRVR